MNVLRWLNWAFPPKAKPSQFSLGWYNKKAISALSALQALVGAKKKLFNPTKLAVVAPFRPTTLVMAFWPPCRIVRRPRWGSTW